MASKDVPKPMIMRLVAPLMWCLNTAVITLNASGTLLIIALMVLICSDVVARNLLASSLPGVIELAELGIVSIVFLQIADTLRSGKLIRSDGLINLIEARLPRLGLAMNALFDITGGVLFYFIARGAFKRFWDAWEGGFYLGNKGDFTAPTWPMEFFVAMGSALMCLLFITKAIHGICRLFGLLPTTGDDQGELNVEKINP